VTVVAGIAPFTDLRRVLELATTGWYPSSRGLVHYQAKGFLGLAIGRSVVAALPSGHARRRLERALGLDEHAKAPLRVLRERGFPGLSASAHSVVALLANRDPGRFERFLARLPPSLRAALARLSPLERAASLTAPVELATAPHDKYFPVDESRALEREVPHVRLTVTSTLQHAIPKLSFSAIGDLFRFNAFLVRVLHAAGEA
jgi:pimeloyl-ACP methyl ester carboxylesterase